jgi:O-antigen ligase
MLVIVAVSCFLLLLGAVRWRQAVICVLVLVVFEGALRKWAFPDFAEFIYLAKDILLLGAYAGFWGPRLLLRRKLFPRHPANAALAAFALVAVLQVANPWLPNIWVGLFGIKAYLLYVPLMYMVPAVFPTTDAMEKFWRRYLLIAFVPLLLGPVQFASSPDSILNRYAWEDELAPGVATFGVVNRARITATFSYMSGYTAYLMLLAAAALALVVFGSGKLGPRLLYSLLALTMANVLMTGSRGTVLRVVLVSVTLLTLVFLQGRRRWGRVLTAAIGLSLVGVLVAISFPDAVAAFFGRVEANVDLEERITGLVTVPAWALGESGVIGYGIGNTHQARRFLVSEVADDTFLPAAEGEWERIIIELGPVGFALVLLARVLVVWRLWSAWRCPMEDAYRPYLAAAFLVALVNVPGPLVFNHTASLLYWFIAGFGLVPIHAGHSISHTATMPHRRAETAPSPAIIR